MEKKRAVRSGEETFVVRIAGDDPQAVPGRWRATVVHVATGERRYVAGLAELAAFIESRRARTP